MGFSQTYEPVYNKYYESEIKSLKDNYPKNKVEKDLIIIYGDWIKDIKNEKESISSNQSNPEVAQKLEDLGDLEARVIREMYGKPAQPKVEEKKVEPVVDSSLTAVASFKVDSTAILDTTPKETIKPIAIDSVIAESKKEVDTVKSETQDNPDFNESTEVKSNSKSLNELLSQEIEGVYYRVQVFAANKQFPGANIAQKLNLAEEIIEEENEGMYKYLVGKFSIYNSARAKADELRANAGVNAFVVGYQNENRTPLNIIFGTK